MSASAVSKRDSGGISPMGVRGFCRERGRLEATRGVIDVIGSVLEMLMIMSLGHTLTLFLVSISFRELPSGGCPIFK